MEGRGAIALRSVDIDLLFEQRTRDWYVPFSNGLDQLVARDSKADRRGEKHDKQRGEGNRSHEPTLNAVEMQIGEFPCAVAQSIPLHAEFVQQRQVQVGQRRVFRIPDVVAVSTLVRSSPRQDEG